MREPPKGMPGVDIVVLESQAAEARSIIADYLDDSEIITDESAPTDSSG
jgi:hypothetical protein